MGENMINKNKYNKIELFLFAAIVILSENAFYLITSDTLNPSNSVHLDDYGIVLFLIWGYIILKKYKDVKIGKYKFKWLILFVFILALVSSIRSFQLYGQPIFMGIRPQRMFIVLFLAYFPLMKILKSNSKFYFQLEKILFIVGGFELVLYIAQYLLYNKVIFLHVPISQRFGDVRLQFSSSIIFILPFFVVNNLVNNYKVKINSCFLIIILFYDFIVIKARLATLGLVATLLIIFIIQRKTIKMKILLSIFGSMLLSIIILSSSIVQSYLAVLNPTYVSNDQNAKIRSEGKKFYLNELKGYEILGRGYINILFKNAYKHSGMEKKYLFVDNGIFGIYFLYGLIGVAWVIILILKFYKYSIRSYLKKNNYLFLGFSIYITLLLPNIIYIYWGWGPFYTAILMAMVESDNNRENNILLVEEHENCIRKV